MPAIVRKTIDTHSGHARLVPAAPFHRTNYVGGSDDVQVNGFGVITVGDKTACGDIAKEGSPTVFVNKKAVHSLGDATEGHDGWLGSFAATGSHDTFVDDIRLGITSVKGIPRTLDDTSAEQAEVIILDAGGDARQDVDQGADLSKDGALFGSGQFGSGSFGGDR